MMKYLKLILGGVGVILLFLGLSFAMGNWGLFSKEYFGTRSANIDRKIYEENQSHVEGTIQHLNRLRLEYETAESNNKKEALRRMILSEARTFGIDKLPYDLAAFINSIQ